MPKSPNWQTLPTPAGFLLPDLDWIENLTAKNPVVLQEESQRELTRPPEESIENEESYESNYEFLNRDPD